MSYYRFSQLATYKHNHARICRIETAHGTFETPAFMPVGTRAGVNNMTPKELSQTGSQIILGGNTYHMLCAPGMDIIQQAGGMHQFMGWHGPMLTDSGGFQIFSLSKNPDICQIDEEGAHFFLPGVNQRIHMTPEVSLHTQKIIGADIIMAFDQCTPDGYSHQDTAHIMNRTHRWLKQSVAYQQQYPQSAYGYDQALFGIIQGGLYEDLRRESADFIGSQAVDGIAIGGETVGFDMPMTVEVLNWIRPSLPEGKARYTMGVGMSPQDLLDVVAEGVDMFDCVAPTRNARHGALYSGRIESDGKHWLRFSSEFEHERLQIKKACFADDPDPIMPDCNCHTCQHFSRGRLHQLFREKAPLFTALATIHNIHVLHMVTQAMKDLILNHEDSNYV